MTIRNFLLLVVCLWMTDAVAQTGLPDEREQLRLLDEAIGQAPKYVAAREERLAQVRQALQQASDPERQLLLCEQLFQMNRAYDNDSALAYVQRYIDLAESLGHRPQADHGRVLMAFQCSTVGLYTESIGILHAIDPATLEGDALTDYYMACTHVCGELAYYSRVPSKGEEYSALRAEYRDSLFSVTDPYAEPYLLLKEQKLFSEQRYDDALKVNDRRLAKVEPGTHEYAIVCFYRYLLLNAQHRQEQAFYWICQSALADVKNAIMDQAAFIELANMMNNEGDFERSYRYIRFTWDCNNRFNTRMRSWQISPILTVIESNYQSQIRHNTRVLVAAVTVVSVLALMLLALLLFLHRRNKQLDAARQEVHKANGRLTQTNTRLAEQASELAGLNAELSALNTQLSEANRVKEEYIGRFMSLCSQYINKLDDYRKMVNRKMKNKELDELFRITKSTELKERELDELYENFDSVFLHLFPTFVDDFNALLQPEFRVQPKEEHRLTTDLRIFALIRLGIEDSSKIAEFLHYSVNTIYNYRARTKNGALNGRDHFEQSVKNLGRFS